MSDMNFSLTTFSKTGKLSQIENALARVAQGKLTIGIRAKNGVVLVTDKKFSTNLVDTDDYQKIQIINPSIGFIYSGIGPDFRLLVREARKETQKYYLTYHALQPICSCVEATAQVIQQYTQSGGVRPFGVSLLVAGYDTLKGPQLYQIDPSGTFFEWKATAIGKNYINAKNFLERRCISSTDESEDGKKTESKDEIDEMELDDAIHIALMTLRESFEGEMTENNIEVGIIGSDKVFRILTPSEVKDYLEEAN